MTQMFYQGVILGSRFQHLRPQGYCAPYCFWRLGREKGHFAFSCCSEKQVSWTIRAKIIGIEVNDADSFKACCRP